MQHPQLHFHKLHGAPMGRTILRAAQARTYVYSHGAIRSATSERPLKGNGLARTHVYALFM